VSSGIVSDANPLGLFDRDREIQPHEYSVDPYGPVRIGGSHALGQADRLIVQQTRSGVDTCICQRCHASIFLPPPRKLMGRWESALGRSFYWWTQHVTPRLCAKCQDRADTIAAIFDFGGES
jgi:hypothetical protein